MIAHTEYQLRAENRSLDARLGEAIRVEEGLRSDNIRLHAQLREVVEVCEEFNRTMTRWPHVWAVITRVRVAIDEGAR